MTPSTLRPTLPEKQKAVLFNTSTNQLSFTAEAALPSEQILEKEHLIKVHSTAITNGELTWAPYIETPWPTEHVPCYDVSGTIVSEVEGSKFKPGDIVFGRIMADREGTARQYATILPSETALVPPSWASSDSSLTDAASVPMSALTAWQALFEQGQLTSRPSESFTYSMDLLPRVKEDGELVGGQAKGKRVLVLGASGGVGNFAVQFAKLAGATAVGTTGPSNVGFVKSLGVDEVVNYRETSLKDWIGTDEEKKFDLVFDCVGGSSMLDGWYAVKPHGAYISVAPGFREPNPSNGEAVKPEGVRSIWFVMDSRGSELAEIAKFLEKGLVKTAVDSVWKMEEWEKAFAKTATGHARGKVVIKIADEE